MTKATYRHDYKVNGMATKLLLKSIREAEVDVHKPYDLFKITDILEFNCVTCRLERYGIGTTGEIIKAIEYLKNTNQI